MDSSYLLEVTYRMLVIVLLLSLPVVVASAVVGLVIGILQAVTQIQDQSIAYGFKLIIAIIVIAVTAAWAGGELLSFSRSIFENIAHTR